MNETIERPASQFVRQCCQCKAIWSDALQQWVIRGKVMVEGSHGYCKDCFEKEIAQLRAAKSLREATPTL
jgi:hypothetical protein